MLTSTGGANSSTLVSNLSDLKAFVPAWTKALTETPDSNFFQTPEWLLTHAEHYGHRFDFRPIWRSGGPDGFGLLALVVYQRKHRVGRLRILSYPLNHWGTTFGPVGPWSTNDLALGLRKYRTMPDWDLLELDWIDGGPRLDQTLAACKMAGLAASITVGKEVGEIRLDGTWLDYWSTRTSKWRNNVRRNEKRLREAGPIELIHWRGSPQDRLADACGWEIYDACESVARASWQSGSKNGTTLCHESVRGFLREVHGRAAPRGMVSMHLLCVDRKPVAFAYNYVWQGRVFGLRAGYDPRFAEAGPGSVLLARVIQDSFERGDVTFDLGETPAQYKRYWQTHAQPRYQLRHYRRTSMSAQALHLACSLRSWLYRR